MCGRPGGRLQFSAGDSETQLRCSQRQNRQSRKTVIVNKCKYVKKENAVALQRAEMRMVRWMCGVKLKDKLPSKELRERERESRYR